MSIELEQKLLGVDTLSHELDFRLWEKEITEELVVFEARDLEIDTLLQRQAESTVGSLAVNYAVTVESVQPTEHSEPMTLHKATELAAEGSVEARKMIEVNARIDYIERSYKAGFYCPPIELEKQADGSLTQNGQTLEEVHTNSIKYIDNPKLKERAKTVEVLNSIRDQYYSRVGLLKDNARLIISPVHDGMDDTEAANAGFFVPTRSVALQLMTEHNGKTIIQVAFVTTKDVQSGVFDMPAIVNFAQKFGKNYEGAGSEEIIGRPLLIDKKLLPDLIVSVTEMFDDSVSEVTGVKRFLGEAVDHSITTQDYRKKFEGCQNVTRSMQSDIDTVVSKLIAARPKTPTEATAKLEELNDQLLKSKIIHDDTIDARVLGAKITYFVEHARYLYRQDPNIFHNQQRDIVLLQKEINKGKSSSCPGGSNSGLSAEVGVDGISALLGEAQDGDTTTKEAVEDCEFISKHCPKCGEANVKTTCKNGKYYGACKMKCVSD